MLKPETANAKVRVENYDWAVRFEAHPEERPAPEEAFRHVEESLDSGVRQNMIVEMPLDGEHSQFWLARVDGVYGPLLKLTMMPEVPETTSKEIFYDLNKRRLFPLGYCQMNRKKLVPPEDIQGICPDWEQLAIKYLEDVTFDTVSMHFIDGEGLNPSDRIKAGTVLDVRSDSDPDSFWPAVVVHNHGGLLRLTYLTSDKIDLNIFYLSERLFPSKSHAGKYTPPAGVAGIDSGVVDTIEDLLDMYPSAPSDLLTSDTTKTVAVPEFVDGSTVEMIHPVTGKTIERATVELRAEAKDVVCFRLTIDPGVTVVRSVRSCSDVLPLGWSERCLDNASPSSEPDSATAADNQLDFAPGQRLEVQMDSDVDGSFEIHTATIDRVVDRRVLLLKDDGGQEQTLVAVDSLKIFPVGWATANNLPLMLPATFLPDAAEKEPKREKAAAADKEDESISKSYWCPPVYFNHRCYSANLLSRTRLAGLPRSVGPGSVKLVMRQVLNLLIGCSFRSSTVLKRLESKSIPQEDCVMEELKGKSRVLVLKANVEVPTKRHQVQKFCQEVCGKLSACPFLIWTERYDREACPADCQNRPKTDFVRDEDEEKMQTAKQKTKHGRKKKRGRDPDKWLAEGGGGGGGEGYRLKRQFSTDRVSTSSDEESTTADGTTAASSRTQSRSNSPDSLQAEEQSAKRKRHGKKEWGTLLPRSEMKTRGARQPDWKVQMMVRPPFGRDKQTTLEAAKSNLKTRDKRARLNPSSFKQHNSYSYHDRHVMEPVFVSFGSCKRSTKRLELPAAFSMSDFPTQPPDSTSARSRPSTPKMPAAKENDVPSLSSLEPPPIRKIRLKSNPEHWSANDTARFLAQTADCSHIAHFMQEDNIDGKAFLLLNYPTVKGYWQLKTATAIKLCRHVESVRLSHVNQFL